MKVLRIIPSLNPQMGGPAQGIRYSIPALQKLAVENEVVCMDNQTAPYLAYDDFTIHSIGAGRGPLQYHPGLISWLNKHIISYDAIVIHGLWSFHSYATTKVVRQLRKQGKQVPRVYVMPHGMLDPWFQRDKSRQWKALRNEIYWRIVEKDVVNSANGLLFTCEQELTLAKETFQYYHPKHEINVGYGITTPPAQHVGMSLPIDNPYLLFLSRIHPKKGVDLLLKAYLQLQQSNRQMPGLVIAGPGLETAYGKELLHLANNNPKIHFTGMLEGDTKWGAIYNCEAFVLPSHQENFGIAVVEALACGKPVLISDQVNIWKEIETGGGGIISPDTTEGTYRALQTWLEMTDESKHEMALNAKEVYLKSFTIDIAAKKLKDALEN